jgi:hypothetical protein
LAFTLVAGSARADHWDPISAAGADVSTQRDGGTHDDQHADSAVSHIRVEDNPLHRPQPDSFAEARNRARTGGAVGSYGAVGGNIVDFVDGDRLSLESDGSAYTSLPFRIQSATLSPGTVVPVDITVNMKGALRIAGTGSLLTSSGTIYVELFGHDDDNDYYKNFLADVSAYRDGVYTLLEIDSDEAPDVDGQVLRDAVRSTITASETNATVDWTQTFRLEMEVGEDYALDVQLAGFALAVNPEDALAIADFFTDANGGAATLRSADPRASIPFVPEPAAATFALAASLMLLHRRRASTLPSNRR